MLVYNSLRGFANALDAMRREFYSMYAATRSIYLIGQYLSLWFLSLSNLTLRAESEVIDLSNDWLDFYDWLRDNLGGSSILQELIRYADDLISFMRYPFDWISDAIREHFPGLYRVAQDPIDWVLETIWRYTGLDVNFTDDPRRIIREIVQDIAGDALDILRDPFGWIRDQLDNIIPDFWLLTSDPRRWVSEKLQEEFPFIYEILRDPDGFIEDRLINFLDDLADRYRDKAVKLAEKILQAIF